MIDATYLQAHRTASSLGVGKDGRARQIGRTKGGMNTKLHAVADTKGRPIGFFLSAGQVSDYTGAAVLPKQAGCWPIANWFRDALKYKGIKACIPGRQARKMEIKYDKRRYKRRNLIEIMFGFLKD